MSINEAFNVLDKLRTFGNKRNDKEELLRQNAENKDLQELMVLTYDWSRTYGITVDDFNEKFNPEESPKDLNWRLFKTILDAYMRRESTGNAAKETWATFIARCNPREKYWYTKVLNRDLRLNMGETIVSKVWPDLLQPFACALADTYDVDKHDLEGEWIAQVKLDGIRMVVGLGTAYTRTGKIIESVGHILDELKGREGYVFDGELMGNSNFDSDSGKARKKGSGPDTSLTYNIFDVIKIDEWNNKETAPLSERMNLLEEFRLVDFCDTEYVKVVPWVNIPNNPSFQDLVKLRDDFIKEGYEGVMFKNMAAPYRFKRSSDLLKFKSMLDADGVVVGTVEGKGKLKGKLGKLIVEFDGVITGVGSGFKEHEREALWAIRDELPGRWVEAFFQGKSKTGALRFPIFHRWRPDKE